MHTSIRRYEGISSDAVTEIIKRAEAGFVPIIKDNAGFVGYYIIDGGNGVLASISVFESAAAADESNRKAANWVKENLADLIPNPPQITAGETKIAVTP